LTIFVSAKPKVSNDYATSATANESGESETISAKPASGHPCMGKIFHREK